MLHDHKNCLSPECLVALHDLLQCCRRHLYQNKDGIIVYTDAAIAGNTKQVRLAVIADNIIRVTASPSDNPEEIKSLIASYDHSTIPAWTVAEEGGNIRLSTSLVVATVRKDNGAVSFTDKAGKPILAERQNNGRSFEPAVF